MTTGLEDKDTFEPAAEPAAVADAEVEAEAAPAPVDEDPLVAENPVLAAEEEPPAPPPPPPAPVQDPPPVHDGAAFQGVWYDQHGEAVGTISGTELQWHDGKTSTLQFDGENSASMVA